MSDYISHFRTVMNYEFKDPSLLREALTHPSISKFRQNNKPTYKNYERFEFLGDAVLSMIITELLLEKYPDETEGNLAKRRAALICGETLFAISKQINLGNYLIMTDGEASGGGRNNSNNLENALEALIGALYVDGGIDPCFHFVKVYWKTILEEMINPPKDPKTSLQEWAQKNGKAIPRYEIVKTEGPPHSPMITVNLYIDGLEPLSSTASSKRQAERLVAQAMLDKIHEN